jgi:hypothetical protein
MRAAQKLLGALTIGGGGVPGQGLAVEEVDKPPSRLKWTKTVKKNRRFPTLIDLKITQNTVFT